VTVYAPQPEALASPVVFRLIGVLDADLIAAFGALERGLPGAAGATVLVDVRDLHVLGETEMTELARAIAAARAEGRDVRLDARNLHWKRAAKQNISKQPAVDAQLRSEARRTVILAHSAKRKH
jgi:anti-anti-sigma regulatory factor